LCWSHEYSFRGSLSQGTGGKIYEQFQPNVPLAVTITLRRRNLDLYQLAVRIRTKSSSKKKNADELWHAVSVLIIALPPLACTDVHVQPSIDFLDTSTIVC